MTTKAPPRHEALRLASAARETASDLRKAVATTTRLTDPWRTTILGLIEISVNLANALDYMAMECEALNRSKAEDSHGH